MKTIKLIAKNIGVIVLSILVLIIGAIAESLVKECFSGQYLRLVIPAFIRIAVTIALACFVSSKLLKMSAKELVFRGMILRYMQRTLGLKAAVILPSLLFACAHIMNMESFNLTDLVLLILAGSSVAVMFTLFALKSDSIYPGAFAHAAWNTLIIGGIFGIGDTVNGMGNDSYIIIPIQSANKLLTGGNFGVEAALPAIIGYIAVALMIGFLVKKEGAKAKSS